MLKIKKELKSFSQTQQKSVFWWGSISIANNTETRVEYKKGWPNNCCQLWTFSKRSRGSLQSLLHSIAAFAADDCQLHYYFIWVIRLENCHKILFCLKSFVVDSSVASWWWIHAVKRFAAEHFVWILFSVFLLTRCASLLSMKNKKK